VEVRETTPFSTVTSSLSFKVFIACLHTSSLS